MVAMTLNAHQIPLPEECAAPPLHPVAGNAPTVLTTLPPAAP